MYCFPYPRESDVTPLQVPYVAQAALKYSLSGQYTFQSFYEETVGNEMRNELRPVLTDGLRIALLCLHPPPASVIQTWLFFGLASEALGRDIAHGEFLEKNSTSSSGQSIDLRIPLRFWSELVARWTRLAKIPDRNKYEREEKKLEDCCNFTTVVLCLLELHGEPKAEDGDTELALVLLSVHMLLYLISRHIAVR
jgi:hypothetical protein